MNSNNKVIPQLLGLSQSIEMAEMDHVEAGNSRDKLAGFYAALADLPSIHPDSHLLGFLNFC